MSTYRRNRKRRKQHSTKNHRESLWICPKDIEPALACLQENLFDEENVWVRIELTQKIIEAVLGKTPDLPLREVTHYTAAELANAINIQARWHIRVWARDYFAWCDIFEGQVEEADTPRQLAAICATRIIPINDESIAYNAAELGRFEG